MPKANTGVDDHARVKVRVIEFELEGSNATVENSIRQLTTALTPRNGTVKALPPKPANKEMSGATTEVEEVIDAEVVDEETPEPKGDTSTAARPKQPKTRSKPRIPEYKPELDMTGASISFKDYVAQKAPTKHTTRYLVAAAWLKEHGNSPTINLDKVFTCYRTAAWPMNITDWDVNFRSQVKTDRFRRVGPGEYQITPIGENDLA
jgi:hypothetical protein